MEQFAIVFTSQPPPQAHPPLRWRSHCTRAGCPRRTCTTCKYVAAALPTWQTNQTPQTPSPVLGVACTPISNQACTQSNLPNWVVAAGVIPLNCHVEQLSRSDAVFSAHSSHRAETMQNVSSWPSHTHTYAYVRILPPLLYISIHASAQWPLADVCGSEIVTSQDETVILRVRAGSPNSQSKYANTSGQARPSCSNPVAQARCPSFYSTSTWRL